MVKEEFSGKQNVSIGIRFSVYKSRRRASVDVKRTLLRAACLSGQTTTASDGRYELRNLLITTLMRIAIARVVLLGMQENELPRLSVQM